MPAAISSVGSLEIPLPTSATDLAIHDTTVRGIADYLAFWLRYALNDALAASATTRRDGTPILDVAPATNVFYWDPGIAFPRGKQDGAANPLPALYVWREGPSRRIQVSITDAMRESRLGVMWLFDEMVMPGAMEDRYGLRAAVDAVLFTACSEGYHPDYGYDTDPDGTPIAVSLKLAGGYPFLRYEGGVEGIAAPVPKSLQSQIPGADAPVVHGYPSLKASILVCERIGRFTLTDPDEANIDNAITIAVNGVGGEGGDALDVLEGVLPGGPGVEDT